jgi:hypothetical protein
VLRDFVFGGFFYQKFITLKKLLQKGENLLYCALSLIGICQLKRADASGNLRSCLAEEPVP